MSVVNKSRMSSGNKIGFYYENLKLIKIAINRVHRHPIYSATVDDSRGSAGWMARMGDVHKVGQENYFPSTRRSWDNQGQR